MNQYPGKAVRSIARPVCGLTPTCGRLFYRNGDRVFSGRDRNAKQVSPVAFDRPIIDGYVPGFS